MQKYYFGSQEKNGKWWFSKWVRWFYWLNITFISLLSLLIILISKTWGFGVLGLSNLILVLIVILAIFTRTCLITKSAHSEAFTIHFQATWSWTFAGQYLFCYRAFLLKKCKLRIWSHQWMTLNSFLPETSCLSFAAWRVILVIIVIVLY